MPGSKPPIPLLPLNTFVVLGPTAVGKSDVAVDLAEQLDGEIVGADAFQIYEGLDILSAKPSPELRGRVPHHLIGEVPLSASFDVARFREMATERLFEIARRGKTPIICGGAGMYIRALTHGLAETPPSDPAIRHSLEKVPLPELVERLRSLDPASTVDLANPRRVIRALEVCIATGRPFSSFRTQWNQQPPVNGVILTRSRDSLGARIIARAAAMFKAGVVEEVARTGEVSPTAAQMIGLQEIREHIAGRMTRQECETRIVQATAQYAKRQLTWFRREQGYQWIDLDDDEDPLRVLAKAAAAR